MLKENQVTESASLPFVKRVDRPDTPSRFLDFTISSSTPHTPTSPLPSSPPSPCLAFSPSKNLSPLTPDLTLSPTLPYSPQQVPATPSAATLSPLLVPSAPPFLPTPSFPCTVEQLPLKFHEINSYTHFPLSIPRAEILSLSISHFQSSQPLESFFSVVPTSPSVSQPAPSPSPLPSPSIAPLSPLLSPLPSPIPSSYPPEARDHLFVGEMLYQLSWYLYYSIEFTKMDTLAQKREQMFMATIPEVSTLTPKTEPSAFTRSWKNYIKEGGEEKEEGEKKKEKDIEEEQKRKLGKDKEDLRRGLLEKRKKEEEKQKVKTAIINKGTWKRAKEGSDEETSSKQGGSDSDEDYVVEKKRAKPSAKEDARCPSGSKRGRKRKVIATPNI